MIFSASFLLLWLSLRAYSAPTEQPRANGFKIPLRTRSPLNGRSVSELGAIAEYERDVAIAKYNPASRRKRSTGYNLIVDQAYDSSYYGSLAIGTPLVSYDILLDTGSADLWVVGNTCGSPCNNLATFDPSASSTFKNSSAVFGIQYGQGDAVGYIAEDTVVMAGFSVSNQGFAVVDEFTTGLLTSPVSGILGLGWQALSASGKTPFWQNLASSGAMDSALFAVQLRRYSNDTSTASQLEPGGELTFGYTNSSLYTGSIDYVDIPGTPSYWYLNIASLTVQGSAISLGSNTMAAIDTGTTNIAGPSSAIQAIYAQIPNSSPASGSYSGYYQYPCSTSVTVELSFGGNSWTMSAADFEYTKISSTECVGVFFDIGTSSSYGSSSPSWVIGDAFLKNVYSVFQYNPPAIGFAALSAEAVAENGVNGPVPSATIGTVTASVTNTSGALPRTRRDVLGALGLLMAIAWIAL